MDGLLEPPKPRFRFELVRLAGVGWLVHHDDPSRVANLSGARAVVGLAMAAAVAFVAATSSSTSAHMLELGRRSKRREHRAKQEIEDQDLVFSVVRTAA